MRLRDAVITGVGVVSPAGVGCPRFWTALLAGKSLVRRVDGAGTLPVPIGAPGPSLADNASRLDRHIVYALRAAEEAIREAALRPADRRHAAVVFGTTVGGAENMEAVFRSHLPSGNSQASFCLGTISAVLRDTLGLRGLNLTITTGCAAGSDAIGIAVDQIAHGRARCVVAGASDATLVPIVMAAFDQVGALSHAFERPECASRPFDVDRSGFVLGEGAAALVLEDADHAHERRQPVLARIRGWSSVASGFHMTMVRADGFDLARAMRRALQRANVSPSDVDLIDAHGTSTRVNDRMESAAIGDVFGASAAHVPLTAQKSVMGHALGAANALEIAGVVHAIRTGVAPPVANLRSLDPECPVGAISDRPLERAFRNVVKLSSSFSGIHTALVLSRA